MHNLGGNLILTMQFQGDEVVATPLPSALATTFTRVKPIADQHAWLAQHTDDILGAVRQAGAVLLRGFEIDTPAAFAAAVEHLVPGTLDYRGGTSPRTQIDAGIYTSTDYPRQYEIALHNEMSYSKSVPDFVFFCCATAPAERGETPLANCNKVLQHIPADIVAEYQERGLMYERNMYGPDSPYNSWAKAFETRDRAVVEQFCRAADIALEWMPNDHLRTRELRPALLDHPVTGKRLWFNQANLWHYSNSPLAADLIGKSEKGLPMNVFFGDGGSLDLRHLDLIRQAYAREKTMFSWQRGDFLVLDNRLVAHGRMPFSGPRNIMVALRSHDSTHTTA